MSLWSSIKSIFSKKKPSSKRPTNYFDLSGKKSSKTTSTTSTSSSRSSTSSYTSSSSSRGSSGGGGGTYNPSTNTYTSPEGYKMSMARSNVPTGTKIVSGGGGTTLKSSTPTTSTKNLSPKKGEVLQLSPNNGGEISPLKAIELGRQLAGQGVKGVPVSGKEIGLKQGYYLGSMEDVKPQTRYQSAEISLSSKIPSLKTLKEKGYAITDKIRGWEPGTAEKRDVASLKRQLGFSPEQNVTQEQVYGNMPLGLGALAEWGAGMYGGFKDKPIKTIGTGIAFFGLPKAIGLAKTGLSSLGFTAGKKIKFISGATKYALGGLYAGSSGYRIITADSPFYEAGEITSTELAPMIIGTSLGNRFWTSYDLWKIKRAKPVWTPSLEVGEQLSTTSGSLTALKSIRTTNMATLTSDYLIASTKGKTSLFEGYGTSTYRFYDYTTGGISSQITSFKVRGSNLDLGRLEKTSANLFLGSGVYSPLYEVTLYNPTEVKGGYKISGELGVGGREEVFSFTGISTSLKDYTTYLAGKPQPKIMYNKKIGFLDSDLFLSGWSFKPESVGIIKNIQTPTFKGTGGTSVIIGGGGSSGSYFTKLYGSGVSFGIVANIVKSMKPPKINTNLVFKPIPTTLKTENTKLNVITLDKQNVKPIVTNLNIQSSATPQISSTKTKAIGGLSIKPLIDTAMKINQYNKVTNKQIIKPIQPQIVKQKPYIFSPTKINPYKPLKPYKTGSPIPPFGFLAKPSLKLNTSLNLKKFSSKSILGYSTSFAGWSLGIKGKRKTPSKLGFTGFEIRPLSERGKIVFEVKKNNKTKKKKKRRKKRKNES